MGWSQCSRYLKGGITHDRVGDGSVGCGPAFWLGRRVIEPVGWVVADAAVPAHTTVPEVRYGNGLLQVEKGNQRGSSLRRQRPSVLPGG